MRVLPYTVYSVKSLVNSALLRYTAFPAYKTTIFTTADV